MVENYKMACNLQCNISRGEVLNQDTQVGFYQ